MGNASRMGQKWLKQPEMKKMTQNKLRQNGPTVCNNRSDMRNAKKWIRKGQKQKVTEQNDAKWY